MSIRRLLRRLVRRHDPGWDQGLDLPTQRAAVSREVGAIQLQIIRRGQEQKALREQILKLEDGGWTGTNGRGEIEARPAPSGTWLVLISRGHCLLWGEWPTSAVQFPQAIYSRGTNLTAFSIRRSLALMF